MDIIIESQIIKMVYYSSNTLYDFSSDCFIVKPKLYQ